jgi:hypothetical protein
MNRRALPSDGDGGLCVRCFSLGFTLSYSVLNFIIAAGFGQINSQKGNKSFSYAQSQDVSGLATTLPPAFARLGGCILALLQPIFKSHAKDLHLISKSLFTN